eukprot:gene407-759_t
MEQPPESTQTGVPTSDPASANITSKPLHPDAVAPLGQPEDGRDTPANLVQNTQLDSSDNPGSPASVSTRPAFVPAYGKASGETPADSAGPNAAGPNAAPEIPAYKTSSLDPPSSEEITADLLPQLSADVADHPLAEPLLPDASASNAHAVLAEGTLNMSRAAEEPSHDFDLQKEKELAADARRRGGFRHVISPPPPLAPVLELPEHHVHPSWASKLTAGVPPPSEDFYASTHDLGLIGRPPQPPFQRVPNAPRTRGFSMQNGILGSVPTVFVLFEVAPKEVSRVIRDRMVWCFKAACISNPGSEMVVITDMRTKMDFLDAFRDGFQEGLTSCPLLVRRSNQIGDIHPDSLARYRLTEEGNYLEELEETGERKHVVFMDTQTLVIGALDKIWARPFDLALTYQGEPMAPVSLRVKFVHGEHLRAVARVWKEAVVNYTDGKSGWDEEQAFFLTIVEHTLDHEEATFWGHVAQGKTLHYNWELPGYHTVDVMLIDCKMYNAVPAADSSGCMPSTESIVLNFAAAKTEDEEIFYRDWKSGLQKLALARAVELGKQSGGQIHRGKGGRLKYKKMKIKKPVEKPVSREDQLKIMEDKPVR